METAARQLASLHKRSPHGDSTDISIVAPAYNEEGNLQPLHDRLIAALGPLGRAFEIIYVDDGSTDDTFDQLCEIVRTDRRAEVIKLRRRFGQTAALAAGIDAAQGEVIVLIDADLQNDPADIPRLIGLLDQGYDVVSGWRQNRQDSHLTRIVPSKIANGLIARIAGLPIHDYGCTLKAYRATRLHELKLYGDMHRFIPAYLAILGARVAELPVNHNPRTSGKSKYGLTRTYRVLLDLLTLKLFSSFATKPLQLFGALGLLSFVIAGAAGLAAIWQAVSAGPVAAQLALAALVLLVGGVQLLMVGLLGELVMRTYYESQDKKTYAIEAVLSRRSRGTRQDVNGSRDHPALAG